MLSCFVIENEQAANENIIEIEVLSVKDYSQWLEKQTAFTKEWLSSTQFKAEAGVTRLFPNESGKLAKVICCVTDKANMWGVGGLAATLPEGIYRFNVDDSLLSDYALAWGLGAYQFSRYKKSQRKPARLLIAKSYADEVINLVESINLVRDCINTPTDDMGPTEFAAVAQNLAEEFGASFTQIIGEDLLRENYHCVYTVGRASDDAPRLIDIRWGDPTHPKLTLVGKGVCFDTGGLDIKPSAYMLLMKKDMGGAAHALGLARMIMQAKLPVSLRVLIPMVENAVSGNAYRPGDVITSRKGLTIEIGNTDAEGRLVLADALTEAVSETPDLLIDLSTLTGAARIALGPDLPAVFSNDDEVVNHVIKHSDKVYDSVWRMPLFDGYKEYLNSSIADLNNSPTEGYGGAITAALFLKEFVPDTIPWLHYDLMAWNLKAKPGKPQGGEAMGLRGLFSYLQERFE